MLKTLINIIKWKWNRNERRVHAALTIGEAIGIQLHLATGVSLGTLYMLLSRLERQGKVESRWGEATAVRGGNRPRFYKLKS